MEWLYRRGSFTRTSLVKREVAPREIVTGIGQGTGGAFFVLGLEADLYKVLMFHWETIYDKKN